MTRSEANLHERRYVCKPGDKTGPHEWEVCVVDQWDDIVVGSFTMGDYTYRQQQAARLRDTLEANHAD